MRTRIFRFIREVQGQPPVVWRVGERLVSSPGPGATTRVSTDGTKVGWSDQAGGSWFVIGVDVEEVGREEVRSYVRARALEKLTSEEREALSIPPALRTCTRCRQERDVTFVIQKNPSLGSFGIDFSTLTAPEYDATCLSCLTEVEMARLLAPVALFVVRFEMSKDAPKHRSNFEYVHAWLQFKVGMEKSDERIDADARAAIAGLVKSWVAQ